MMQCLQILYEPTKNVTAKFKEFRKKSKNEKREPLDESQQFIVNLAKDLRRVCQRSEVLEHISSSEDVWPTLTCRSFILEWASMLESKQSVWPGEQVVVVLDDFENHWRRGRMATLQSALELVFWTLLNKELDKENIPQKWLMWKQRIQNIGATPYIPHTVWDWICDAGVEVTLDLDTANPDLLISEDEKRMRCGFERKDVPNYHQRFDGWWCAVGTEGFSNGRHYWEVDVGEMDWRIGMAKESALRKGFKSLNTATGYLTLRLERGTELKALTVPFTALPATSIPRKVGIYLDIDKGQLSFYNVESRSHIYTYNETFDEKLFPIFGTVEIMKDLVIRLPRNRSHCMCPSMCLWG
ncbi:butyrophilin subfamily 3 member A3 isoform X2 [Myxocyprinus asiaticus]|uniref:butyrophilin subfamily 3 member A3 isoform X2 n=1 Tax=Myxocyprinus asiaticus TaxID=70543 RepID=UPI0022212DA5|nr:butyrophilin subfamily 3 member A3 isoform X2 [Myxocyprinus asiaticus]